MQKNQEAIKELAKLVNSDSDSLSEVLEYGLQAGKRNEFYEISKHLGLERDHCLQLFTTNLMQCFEAEFISLTNRLELALSAQG